MQNGFFKTYGKVILFAFLGISIVAAVIGQNKQNNTLAVYTSTDVVQQETLSDSSSEEDNIETQIYADNTYHFSISIPKRLDTGYRPRYCILHPQAFWSYDTHGGFRV